MTADKTAHPPSTASADQSPSRASVPFALELPTEAAGEALICPNCGRGDALATVGELLFCLACGYSSEGGRGCT